MSTPKQQRSKTQPTTKARTTLRISVKLASMTPEERIGAEKDAREGAVIGLWQAGRLSTREAAAELGLGYYDYVDLLARKNIPVLQGELEEGEVQRLVQSIQASQP